MHMRKTIIATFLTLFACVALHAQTRLVGRVLTPEQQAIEGVVVTLANQGMTTTTNAEGKFSLTYLEAIDEDVIIEAVGYISDIVTVELKDNQLNDMGDIVLQTDIVREAQDVFNSTVSFAWSNARYRGRGYEQTYESNYIEGLSFNSAERGQFNFSAMGGLNDATRYKEV